jgi:hypothetical protein
MAAAFCSHWLYCLTPVIVHAFCSHQCEYTLFFSSPFTSSISSPPGPSKTMLTIRCLATAVSTFHLSAPPVASPNQHHFSLFQHLAAYGAAGKGLEYPPSFPAHLGADVIALTRDCCQPHPEKRPTASQAAERLGMFVAKMWIEQRKQAGTWETYKGAVASTRGV